MHRATRPTLFLLAIASAAMPRTATAGALEDVATANAAGRAVILAVADGPGPGLESAKAAAQKAQSYVQGSSVVTLDRRDPAQRAGVDRFGLHEAQAPTLVLVSKNGLVVAHEPIATGAAERLGALAPQATALASTAAANAAGRSVFLIVTDGPGAGLDTARATARAAQIAVPSAVVVELDRRDPAQSEGVAKFRVAAAPVPLVIVVATNGVGVGAAKPGEGAAERLAGMVPSKAKADYLHQLSQKRVAIVLISRASMQERSALFEQASVALKTLVGKASLVLVDLDDPAEARFIAELNADPASARPVVQVINPKGQVLERFTGVPTADQMVKAVSKKHCCSDPNCKH